MDRVWLLGWLEVIWQNGIVNHVCLLCLLSLTWTWVAKLAAQVFKNGPLYDQCTFLIVNIKQFMQIGWTVVWKARKWGKRENSWTFKLSVLNTISHLEWLQTSSYAKWLQHERQDKWGDEHLHEEICVLRVLSMPRAELQTEKSSVRLVQVWKEDSNSFTLGNNSSQK